jgi:hypothetical protein
MDGDELEYRQYRARIEQLLHWFIKGSDSPHEVPWIGHYMITECPDCGNTVTAPDGVHDTAGVWEAFTIITTCQGRRLIPVEDPRWSHH